MVGKVILVTGAAGGVGKHICRQLAAKGAHLILWDVYEPGLRAIVDELAASFPSVTVDARAVDLSTRASIVQAAADVQERIGPVYGVINNAAVMSSSKAFIDEAKAEDVELIMKVNVLAHVWTIQAFLPTMLARQEGHFCFVASIAGQDLFVSWFDVADAGRAVSDA